MSKLDNLYAEMPVWLQNFAVSVYGAYWHWLRFGPGFNQYVKEFKSREGFTKEEWHNWTQTQLIKYLTLVIEKVPYYSQNYSDAEKRAARIGDLKSLPLLEKDVARSSPHSLVRSDITTKEYIFHTSGTTGTPIDTIWTLSDNRKSLALREARSANWAGVSFSMPRATFSGRLVEPDPDSKGPYYRYNAVEKQVYFSAFHLKPDTAIDYVRALWKHHIEWMTGYAVSYYLLAKFIVDQGIEVPPLKAVITTSEKLTPEMRVAMEAAYKCRVFEEYSTVENALFASECEFGSLHVSPDAGIVEILREDGSPCNPGEVGEVICTCLLRDYQPLIRYRLGDLAAWSADPCPCGRKMPVIKEVTGRIEDVVIGPDGRQMVRFHGIFADNPNVIEGQIIQESLNQIIVKVLPTENFKEDDSRDIINRVHQRLSDRVDVQVELVNEIPRSSSGKFKAVISKVIHDHGHSPSI